MINKKIILIGIFMLLIALAGCASKKELNSEVSVNENSAEEDNKEIDLSKMDYTTLPTANIELKSGGSIKIALFPEIAPNTVNNFIALSQSGFYNGLTFHRVIPKFMIQGGDPLGNGTGNPGYSIKGEFNDNDFVNNLKHVRGVLSMARSNDYNSAGSQFFIMQSDYSSLDNQYAGFGYVIEGIEEVDKIVAVDRDRKDKPVEPIIISTIDIELNGYEIQDVVKIEN